MLAPLAVALAMGLHATHMLVPPTPGPLAVAGILGSNLGLVIFCGMLVSIPVTIVAIIAGRIFGKKYYFLPEIEEAHVDEKNKKLPSAFMSFAPIIVPIILMLLKTVGSLEAKPFGTGALYNVFDSLGQTIVALLLDLLLHFLHIDLFIQTIKMCGLLMEYLESL